jgi:hypothetical protein
MMARASRRTTLAAWVAVVIAVGVVGYLVGEHRSSSTVTVTGPGIADLARGSGTAYVGANEPLNRQPYGFAYSIPSDLSWSDSSGSLHEGGRPSCLPSAKAVHVKDIEAVQFATPDGATTGTVLWVQC